ncbi:hypothetical protein B0H14DRAFT_3745057 [Mycena olivaceomarginata]|nr:hypothetical protein B0H14DRAFT_3745057 [Mycena olivaceomarginata]
MPSQASQAPPNIRTCFPLCICVVGSEAKAGQRTIAIQEVQRLLRAVPLPQYGTQQTHSKRDPLQAGGNGAGRGWGLEGTSDNGHGQGKELAARGFAPMLEIPRFYSRTNDSAICISGDGGAASSCLQVVLNQSNYKMPHQPDVPPQDPARTFPANHSPALRLGLGLKTPSRLWATQHPTNPPRQIARRT